MAHADYDCCAICDSKQSYNSNAEAKERICGPCVANLVKKTGIIVGSPSELIEFIQKASADIVENVLTAVSFCLCFYGNPVDDAVEGKCPGKFKR